MNIAPSKRIVEGFYKLFENPNEEMGKIRDGMLEKKPTGTFAKEVEGVKLDTVQAILAFGFRDLLDLHIEKILEEYKNHPMYDLIIDITRRRSRELELKISTELFGFEAEFDHFFRKKEIRKIPPWTNKLIESFDNAKNAISRIEGFINDLVGDKNSFFSPDGNGITREQLKYIRTVDHEWDPKTPVDLSGNSAQFRSKWNSLMSRLMKKYCDKLLSDITDLRKIRTIIGDLYKILDKVDYIYMLQTDLEDMKEFLKENLLNVVVELSSTRIVPSKSTYRKEISPENLEQLMGVISYPLAHGQVAEIAAERVRKNLLKQFKGVQIEPSLIGKLEVHMAAQFKKALVPPGHRVGLIAAQAAGENASQAGLRSFHHAGISGGTGFERIEAITGMSKKNAFTIVALKGMPSRDTVYHYSRLIESTMLGDFCQFSIGRTNPEVPEADEIFGDTPVYIAEKGGWQERFVAIDEALGVKGGSRPSFKRPDWIVRIKCDSDFMVQNKISMGQIASSIEFAFKDYRVITSDIVTGLIDVYPEVSKSESSAIYSYLKISVIRNLNTIKVKGLTGFEKTLVEKYSIVKFIDSVEQKGENAFVRFSQRDIAYNGVPKKQIIGLLRSKKGDPQAQIITENGFEFVVPNMNAKELHKKLIEQEVVKLEGAISEVQETEQILKVTLNRKLLRIENDVPMQSIKDFFSQQNGLRHFDSVDIFFNPDTFVLSISPSKSFTGPIVLEQMKEFRILPEEILNNALHEDTKITLKDVPTNTEVEKLQNFISSYGTTLNLTIPKSSKSAGKVTMIIDLNPMGLSEAYQSLLKITKGCDVVPTVFVSAKKQMFSDRYRILAQGANTLSLLRAPFVNIYATIPSSPIEIFEHFDIEATQAYCYGELVLNAGGSVGNRHLGLLADTLTYMGVPTKMDIAGKKMTEGGVMATASFQQPFQIMLDSSAANISDEIRSNVSMTLVGDFERAERGKTVHEDPRLDSAIGKLMSATLFESNYKESVPEKPKRVPRHVREKVAIQEKEKVFQPEQSFSKMAEELEKDSIL